MAYGDVLSDAEDEEEHNIWTLFLALVGHEVVSCGILGSLEDGELGRVGLDWHFALDLLCEEMHFFLSVSQALRVQADSISGAALGCAPCEVSTSQCTWPFVVLCATQETRSSLLTLFSHSGVTSGCSIGRSETDTNFGGFCKHVNASSSKRSHCSWGQCGN